MACDPPIAEEPLEADDFYPTADRLFELGHYIAAAKAYSQTYACEGAPLHEGVNPATFEGDYFFEFEAAIARAAGGDFLGAAGDYVSARRSWAETLAGSYCAIPDDGVDPAQT